MKKPVNVFLLLAAFLAATFTACSKKEESPEPVQKTNPIDNTQPNNPPPQSKDTAALFVKSGWIIKKIYKDGQEQMGHFLVGAAYSFNAGKTYIFSMPGFPSASGTWDFSAEGRKKAELIANGGSGMPTTWNILSISSTAMVVEEPQSNGVWKYDFSH